MPEIAAVEAALDNPEEMGKIQSALKAVIKERYSRYALHGLMMGLPKPYLIYVLKKAKEFMTREDFSVAMACASYGSLLDDELREYNDLPKDEIRDELLELLKACDPKILGIDKLFQGCPPESEVEVYLDEPDYFEPNTYLVFYWFSSPEKLIEYYSNVYGDGRDAIAGYGVYTAKIKVKDIFGCPNISEHDVILNPDKLYDIKYINDVTKWDEYFWCVEAEDEDDDWDDEDESEDEE